MKSNKYIRLLVLILFLFPFYQLKAQNTLYNLNRIPQSNLLNPAIQPKCNFYLGMPGGSGVNFGLSNNSFSLNDIITTSATDTIIDIDQISSTLHDVNYFRTEARIDLTNFGFRVHDWYFSLNASTRVDARIGFPDDIINIKNGNWDAETDALNPIDFSGLQANVIAFNEIGIGVGYELNEQWSVGGRIKYLMGAANVTTRKSSLSITPGYDEDKNIEGSEPMIGYWDVAADFEMNTSAPLEVSYDEDGIPDSISVPEGFGEDDPVNDFVLNNDRGMAFDFGGVYRLNDQITVSASLIDFGWIKWKTSPTTLSAKGNYRFEGIDVSDEITEDDQENTEEEKDIGEQLQDSLLASLTIADNSDPYTTWLNPKLYIGGTYYLNKNFNFGLLTRTEIFDGKLHPSLTLSATANFFHGWSTRVSYSMMNYSYNNLGFGLGMNVGPFQFYVIADKIPIHYSSVVENEELPDGSIRVEDTFIRIPYKTQAINVRLGFNLVFGCAQKVELPSVIYNRELF